MIRVPESLEKNTIIATTFETRFRSNHPNVGDLLPGLLYHTVGKKFPKIMPLPLSQVPAHVRAVNAEIAAQPTQSLHGPTGQLLIGNQLVGLARTPYPGWNAFRPEVLEIIEALKSTGLINSIERLSLRYVNVINEGIDAFDLNQLRISVSLGELSLKREGFATRAEVEQDECTGIVDIRTGGNVTVTSQGVSKSSSGVLVSIDAVWSPPGDDTWDALPDGLEKIHTVAKTLFFELLTPETLSKLGPRWSPQ